QAAVAGEVDVDDLDVGIDVADVILPGELAANAAVAALVVDRVHPDAGALLGVIMQVEQPKLTDQVRAQKLADEAFVAVVGPDVAQHGLDPASTCDFRKPLTVLLRRLAHDALDVLHHGKAERVRVEAREALIIEFGLE